MTFSNRFTHYFVEFCRDSRLRTFLEVVQKNLQHTCSKRGRGGGGQGPFEQCSKKLHYWFRMASLTKLRPLKLEPGVDFLLAPVDRVLLVMHNILLLPIGHLHGRQKPIKRYQWKLFFWIFHRIYPSVSIEL